MTVSPADHASSADHAAAPTLPAPVLSLGAVTLSVADLGRSLEYYRHTIGLSVLEQWPGRAVLGVEAAGVGAGSGAASGALLELHEQPGASPSRPGHPGLYHMAILLPSRADLGRFVSHLIKDRIPVQGASDHLVSEAVYLQDPDGHGTEVYADRDRAGWTWQGDQVRMGTQAADIGGIVASAADDPEWRGLPTGTVMGHVHLKVSDLGATRSFYEGLLGLDVVVDLSLQGALFVSQGGYHHHFGLNIWQSRGGQAAPDGEARLLSAQVYLPAAELEGVRARLLAAGYPVSEVGAASRNAAAFTVSDPSGNLLRFGSRAG